MPDTMDIIMKNSDQSLFQFQDYKEYLGHWIKSQPSGGHGTRRKMATAIQCQTAFISQVLNGPAHFSLEQADKLNSLLGHSKDETRFFLLLVQYTRAGTESLREHFRQQLLELAAKRHVLKDRLAATHELSKEDHNIFFSSWSYSAVHVLLSIPGHQTRTALAQALRLPPKKIGEILEFFISKGLAIQEGEKYRVGKMHLHLGNDSSMIVKHHLNWRLKAMEAIEQEEKEEMHYSSILSLSKEDVTKIKNILADNLSQVRKVVDQSKEEEAFSLCLDFFKVNK